MQLSPLQSRLAASLAASLVVLVLYLLLFAPSAALAAELEARLDSDISAPIESPELAVNLQEVYEPEFGLLGRDIIGRVPSGVTPLHNNEPARLNLQPGTFACYMIEKSVIFGSNSTNSHRSAEPDSQGTAGSDGGNDGNAPSGRQATSRRTVYLSANTCLQPHSLSSNVTGPDPPQLALYIFDSSQNGCPNHSQGSSGVHKEDFNQGAVMYSLGATDSIFLSVTAPSITKDFQGIYNFEVAASIDDYYHRYDSSPGQLLWMDSDSSSALLVTRNLTQDFRNATQVMEGEPPYELFVENKNTPSVRGMLHSACGLSGAAQIASKRLDNGQLNNGEMVRTKMTTRGPGNWPKQQFYFQGLNSSTSYAGVLVKPANKTSKAKRQGEQVGGGGVVFAATDFQTSAGTNCKMITDLEFCDDVQWAAPGNSNLNNTALGKVYDDYASEMYANFEKVMMQIPCEANPTQQYSLARNCDDCKRAYKRWLCTVTIPRCEDYMSDNSFAIVRNGGQPFPNGTKLPDSSLEQYAKTPAMNSSRNSFIDETIAPGPYREILPCDDICYEVVQSCPAAIGFTCPLPKHVAYDGSYARRYRAGSLVSCNYPGEPRTRLNAAGTVSPDRFFLGIITLTMVLLNR